MAELVENVQGRAVVADAHSAHPRVSWGAVFAGAVTAVGLWMLLYAFGLAIGASTINVRDSGSAKATGIFEGVWGVVAPLIALFIGGFVAGRGAGVIKRGDGALHGFITWGIATIAGAWVLVNLLGAIGGGLASMGRGVAQVAGSAGANASQAMQSAGLDANDLVRPLNQRLQAEGRPTVTADQIEAAARDTLQRSVRTGRIDHTVVVQSVTQNTPLTRADADQLAGQLEDKLQNARSQMASGVQSATRAASKAFWGAFVALLLGLIAAIVGGAEGVPRSHRQRPRREAAVPPPVPAPRGPTAPREVYP